MLPEKQPDEIGTWPTFARLVLQRQEDHETSLKKLTNNDSGFSITRCLIHDKAIQDFRNIQYKIAGGLSVVIVICSFASPLLVAWAKKLLHL